MSVVVSFRMFSGRELIRSPTTGYVTAVCYQSTICCYSKQRCLFGTGWHRMGASIAGSGLVFSRGNSSSSHQRTFGIYKENKNEDIAELVENFTAPSLARALRDREETLQQCADLSHRGDYAALAKMLSPFLKENIAKKRKQTRQKIDIRSGFDKKGLAVIQRLLHRQPREVTQSSRRRASVIIPLCNDRGVASVLFERRSEHVRTHKHEVCFPGGMVDNDDPNIIHTSVREMEEEIGVPANEADILGILRCDWTELSNLTGVSVTPVVGFIGNLEDKNFSVNHDEVDQVFTVPITKLLDKNQWQPKTLGPPAFNGGPFVIWGLTAYILDRFLNEIIGECDVTGHQLSS